MHRIAVTPGEPAGIGPELLVRLVQQPLLDCELVAVADAGLLQETARRLALPLQVTHYDPQTPRLSGRQRLTVSHIPLRDTCTAGTLNPMNAEYVIATLRKASELCLQERLGALVTGPVHKGVINDAGIHFSGHTEYFAEQAGCDQVVMMLATEGLRVALATTHLPLKDVSAAITQSSLTRTIEILHHSLVTQFGITKPRILVSGLNPHAGEGGHLGHEEIDQIQPVLAKLRNRGMILIGPLPADTLFTEHYLRTADAVLAMYHDQGLPVLKYKGFGKAVNITLGLPFIRTSVDHGTALDLVGKATADIGSLQYSVTSARTMIEAQNNEAPENSLTHL